MKDLIAVHQCHYDSKDQQRMVAQPGTEFSVDDKVADVLVPAGAALLKVTENVVQEDKPVTEKPAAKAKATKTAAKAEKPEDKSDDEDGLV